MTWQLTNGYGANIDVRFFDETANGVWPDSISVYYITSGQVLDYPLACAPGNEVCMGAEDETQTGTWGVALDNAGARSTPSCSLCDGAVHPITFTP